MSCVSLYRQIQAGTLSASALTDQQIADIWQCLNVDEQAALTAMLSRGAGGTIDYEYKLVSSQCFQEVADANNRYTRSIYIPIIDGAPQAAVTYWIDEQTGIAGLVAPIPALEPCAEQFGAISTNWSQQYLDVTPAVIPVASPVRSLTLTVLIGTVTVTTDDGSGFVAPTSSSWTWSGDVEGLDLTGFTFTGSVGASYVLHGEKSV